MKFNKHLLLDLAIPPLQKVVKSGNDKGKVRYRDPSEVKLAKRLLANLVKFKLSRTELLQTDMTIDNKVTSFLVKCPIQKNISAWRINNGDTFIGA